MAVVGGVGIDVVSLASLIYLILNPVPAILGSLTTWGHHFSDSCDPEQSTSPFWPT